MAVSWDALAPGESILQYAARRRHVHPLGGLGIPLFTRDGDGLHPRQLVELCGAEGSGKSEILLGAIAACVTPAAFGGAGAEAVILDADRKFSLLRLITLIEDRVKRASDPETVVRQCLSRVEVASIDSAFQLGATLLCLAETLTARPAVQLVVVDSIGAHHWVDRATSGTEHGQTSVQQQIVCRGMRELLARQPVTVLVAKPSLTGTTMSKRRGHDRNASPHDYTPQEWRGLVTRRYVLLTDEYAQSAHHHHGQDGISHKLFQRIHPPSLPAAWVPFSITNRGLC